MKRLFKTLYSWYIQDRNRGRIVRKMRRRQKQLTKAIELADLRAKSTGKKQWVLDVEGGALKILNREEIKLYQRVGLISKDLEGLDFDRVALYVAQISNKKFIDNLSRADKKRFERLEKKSLLSKSVDAVIEAGDDAKESLIVAKRNISKVFKKK